MKTDSLGNLKWQKTYNYSTGTYQINNGYSIDITTDGGYIIGAECGSTSITQFSSLIVKTDSLGNVKWKSIPVYDGSAFVAATSDGGGIVTCSYATTSQPLDELYVLKYDVSGSIQWQKKFGPPTYGNYPWGIYVTKDSNYIVTGNTTIDSSQHIVGFVTKISSIGNMAWYGTYDFYKGTNDQNYLRDIEPTSDGGYVASGFAWPYIETRQYHEDVWVIKLDSNGCDTIGHCPVVTGINEISPESNSVKIFPNPSTGIFTFNLSGNNEKANLIIYNMLGENICKTEFNTGTTQINLSSQPAGIYLYRIVSEKGEAIANGKLVIE